MAQHVVQDFSPVSIHDTDCTYDPDGKMPYETQAIILDSDETSNESFRSAKGRCRNSPRWRQIRPLSGLCSLCIALASMFASLAILVRSNGAPVADWNFTPSVYLGVSTAVANPAIAYSFVQAATVAWWNKASNGATVAGLQRDWSSGTSLIAALRSGHRIRLLGIACIACALVVIDGPLLQGATSVIPVPIVNTVRSLHVKMAPEVPTGYTGIWVESPQICDGDFGRRLPTVNGTRKNNICTNQTPEMYAIAKAFMQNSNAGIDGIVTGCEDRECRAKVKAPALSVSACRTENIPLDLKGPWNSTDALQSTDKLLSRTTFVLSVDPSFDGSRETLDMLVGYATLDDCSGNLNFTTCSLESATGLYEISIKNNTVIPVKPVRPVILDKANNTQRLTTGSSIGPSTLFGISSLFLSQFSGNVQFLSQSFKDIGAFGSYVEYIIPTPNKDMCQSFVDPTQATLDRLNELLFRIGASAAQSRNNSVLLEAMDPGLEVDSVVNGTVIGTHNVFHTNYYYFVGAVALQILCIALVLPLYQGFWTLSRCVSFSPLEIAKAFDASLLSACEANSSGQEVAMALGEQPLRYDVARNIFRSSWKDMEYDKPQEV